MNRSLTKEGGTWWATDPRVRLRDESALFEEFPYEVYDFRRKRLHLAEKADFELLKFLRYPRHTREIAAWLARLEPGIQAESLESLEELGLVERTNEPKPDWKPPVLFESAFLEGDPYPPQGFPTVIMLQPTAGCNLACRHCSARAAKIPGSEELTLSEIERILDELVQCDCRTLRLTGGEPMTRPDFFEITEMIRSRDLNFFLFTNGTLLTEENIRRFDRLDRSSFQVHLSLDGGRESHNWLRARKFAYDGVLRAFRLLRERGIPFCVEMTLNSKNCGEIEQVIKECIAAGAYALAIHPAQALGRGANEPAIRLSLESLRRTALEVDELALRYSRQIQADFFVYTLPSRLIFTERSRRRGILRDSLAEVVRFRRPNARCGAGMGQFTISPLGEVFACPLSVGIPGHSAGSVRRASLLEIWSRNDRWRFYRGGWKEEELKLCSRCPSRAICEVGAHCRPNCFHGHGDLLGPPLECLNEYKALGIAAKDAASYLKNHLKDYGGPMLDRGILHEVEDRADRLSASSAAGSGRLEEGIA